VEINEAWKKEEETEGKAFVIRQLSICGIIRSYSEVGCTVCILNEMFKRFEVV
jgi:hypothetical protein